MFEHRTDELLPRSRFYVRLLRAVSIAAAVVFGSLGLGVVGYHYTEKLPWLDSLLNASMILFGMGPVNDLKTSGGKLFASFYAMFSGVAFLTVAALLFGPVVHRFLHRFHLELEDEENEPRQ